MLNPSIPPDGGDRCVVRCALILPDSAHDSGPRSDGVQSNVVGARLGHRVILLVFLLELKGYHNSVCILEFGVVVCHLSATSKEPDVLEFEDLGPPFLPLLDAQVLARPASEKVSSNGELGNGSFRLRRSSFCQYSQHSDREGLLLDWLWVCVSEGSEEP